MDDGQEMREDEGSRGIVGRGRSVLEGRRCKDRQLLGLSGVEGAQVVVLCPFDGQ